jgi:hypothetical protein
MGFFFQNEDKTNGGTNTVEKNISEMHQRITQRVKYAF